MRYAGTMTKTKKFLALAASAALVVGLSACAPGDGGQVSPGGVREFTVTLDDGTTVPCIKVDSYYGIDCNWDKAVRTNTPKA
jgi:hypothetical protein